MAPVYLTNAYKGTVWVQIDSKHLCLKECESQCVWVSEQGFDLKIRHDMGIADFNKEMDNSIKDSKFMGKTLLKLGKKAVNFISEAALCANCTYRVADFADGEEIIIDVDDFELADGFLLDTIDLDTMICYPKLICSKATVSL